MGSGSIMGLAEDGRSIHCDGDGCGATAPFPVALRPVLASNHARSAATARGWLCVLSQENDCYFCPVCAVKYLNALGSGIHLAGDFDTDASDAVAPGDAGPAEKASSASHCNCRS